MGQARMELDLRPLSPVLGAEVLGVDLAQTPDDTLFAALRDAFLRHHLLLFRNQTFDADQHTAFARKCLYLGEHASHIAGMPLAEGRALVNELNAHCTQPQYTYTYRWSVGDAVMWDNRCLLHSATEFDWMNDVRILRRTTTVGESIAPVRQTNVAPAA